MIAADDRIWLFVAEPPLVPGRTALARLRGMLLSNASREELDAEFFKTLDPAGSDRLLKVSRSMIYRVEGHNDYREDDDILLCSRDNSIDCEPSGFWDEWLALPKYTTNYNAALGLKSAVLGFGRTVVLEEFESLLPESEDMLRIEHTFRAEIKDTESATVRGPIVDTPAVAVLAAMLDYLLGLSVQSVAS
jgi:hypothetical protein